MDHVEFASDAELMKLINDEILVYTTKVMKPNKQELMQERTIVITDKHIYNVHKGQVKRVLDIGDLLGVSKTMPAGNELGIHVK